MLHYFVVLLLCVCFNAALLCCFIALYFCGFAVLFLSCVCCFSLFYVAAFLCFLNPLSLRLGGVSRIHMSLLTPMAVGFGWDYMGSGGRGFVAFVTCRKHVVCIYIFGCTTACSCLALFSVVKRQAHA